MITLTQCALGIFATIVIVIFFRWLFKAPLDTELWQRGADGDCKPGYEVKREIERKILEEREKI